MSMGGRDHQDIAMGVIADAERAVADLSGRQTDRDHRIQKLNDLFVVVEQRYQAMREDLRDRDARIEALEETNDLLIAAIQGMTARIQASSDALDQSDSGLTDALARSETLVSEAFGTGGNANPTQPPETPPHPDEAGDESEPFVLEDLEDGEDGEDSEDSGASATLDATLDATDDDGGDGPLAMAGTMEDPADADGAGDDLVFEESPLPGDDLQADAEEEEVGSVGDGLDADPGADDVDEDPADLALVSDDDGEEPVTSDDEADPLVPWTETWSVGAAAIDEDHRVMAALINRLPDAFREPESDWVVGHILNTLWEFTDFHFGREEALLRAANFPGAADHAGRHADLKQQLRTWLDQYQKDPDSVDAETLQTFLKSWLMNHILGEDMRYKPYVEKNTDAQALAEAMPVPPEVRGSLEDAGVV
ncbi:bacteriohemerythrin [Roseospira marina]|uniref:Bacteriohemerythrin n=1 Tax=Roseospira marina TaxID=140057 RepID=A0A5M6IFG8_9PROT|nr:bacteriohemerythrin [Roseospira marina]KAA5607036.1 bacteriohemerythrin [Roseospira marina]MBB4312777.1 hemerythrin-like metal-binding protein [Roseospira marina]MBB5086450.1 hemerythrin-like metal-binding protein [Roseospira marina]